MSLPRTPLARLKARARAAGANSVRVVASARAQASAADGTTEVAPSTAELWLYGTVGGYWWGFDSDLVADALRSIGADVELITVRLHSFGGSAPEGIAIGNLLANHPATVRVVVDGMAASAATQIALAGEELIMSPGSQFMVHDAWTFADGNARELRAVADWIDKQSANYAETYAHRVGGTANEWRARMTADPDGTWYTAQEAVDAGIADRVANIASTTPPPPVPEVDLDEDGDMAAAAEWDFEALIHPAARKAWTNWRGVRAPKPPTASAEGSNNTQEETAMAFTPEQLDTMRQELGLAETADEATIVAALSEALAEQADPAAPTTPAVPEGMVLVDAATLQGLRDGAQAGATALQLHNDQARDNAIEAAVSDGRILASRREHYVTAWDADPEGTRELLAQLAPGLVPLEELGTAENSARRTADDQLYADVFGDEKKGA